MLKNFLLFSAAILFWVAPSFGPTFAEGRPLQDAPASTNPVKPTAASLERAKKLYQVDCAMCHGDNGNGKGDLVADMHLSMKDLTDPDTLKNVSDGELFSLIKNGKGKMPGEGDRAKDEAIWNLVIYVRSLAKK